MAATEDVEDDDEAGPGLFVSRDAAAAEDDTEEGFIDDDDVDELLLLSAGLDSGFSFSLSESESLSEDSLSLDESLLSLLESLFTASLFLLFDLLFVAAFSALVGAEMSFSVLFLPPGGLPTLPELGLPRT